MSEKKRVAVGLSGGVDSALSAYLLKKQGYEVVGMTMATWDGSVKMPTVEGREGCYGPSEDKNIEEAKLVAERLGIPHYVVPVAEDYKREVLDYFRAEYRAGRTPNPCVRCNQSIKFGALQHAARKLGIDFDYFATGHYARLDFKNPDVPFLYEALDEHKDQTYFLSRLSAEQLSTVIFPLGGMQKADVKALAKEIGWDDFATKRESQDFIECGDYSVLFDESDNVPGDFIDVNGKVLGKHKGIVHYTIGQRRGLGIPAKSRLYISDININDNTITLSDKSLLTRKIRVINANLIAFPELPENFHAFVKVRYRQKELPATINQTSPEEFIIEFNEAIKAPARGQAAVIYDNDYVIGGGTIADIIVT